MQFFFNYSTGTVYNSSYLSLHYKKKTLDLQRLLNMKKKENGVNVKETTSHRQIKMA